MTNKKDSYREAIDHDKALISYAFTRSDPREEIDGIHWRVLAYVDLVLRMT